MMLKLIQSHTISITKLTALLSLLGAFALATIPQIAFSQTLEGNWSVEEAEREMRPNQEFLGASVIFNADLTFSIQRLQRTPWRGTYSIDPESGTINLTFRGRNLTPPTDGTVWEGIYRFGSDDTLVINTATGHDARPLEFMTGYDLTMITLRRAN
ncbi:MAG: hypothetical protein CMM56_08725 [Rhodospirillaceae bacterium]|nr:hypothetical protein [Rhodospirillaceae bacterium]|tara:strand:- start:12864 stop:13331 length:468 start_codon:yes stop_codon:yes gene_type:complete